MDLITSLAAVAGGVARPVGMVGWLIWRDRHPKRGRVPSKDKLLRPAGHSVSLAFDDAWLGLLPHLLGLMGCGAMVGLAIRGWGELVWGIVIRRFPISGISLFEPTLIQFLLFSGGFGAGSIYFAGRVYRSWIRIANLRLGMRGEQAVGEYLGHPDVARAGYRVFHDVPGDGAWNIDHVVVGPGGVFVIETKARTKRPTSDGRRDYEVLCEGRTLKFPDWDDVKTVEQADRNARWLQGWLGGYVTSRIECVPVVALPGWLVSWGKPQANTIHVFNPKNLPKFLSNQGARYSPKDLIPALRALEERCRTLEF